MNKLSLLALSLLAFAFPCIATAAPEVAIKKVEVQTPTSPVFPQSDAVRWTPQKWVKIEVTFDSNVELTDELTFNYYVLTAENRLLVGHVDHVNIAKGRDLHSVMFISPKSIIKILGRKTPGVGDLPLTQATVTIAKPGAESALAMGNLKGVGQAAWWANMKPEEGFLMNKSETPFAPLCWDYYESIKPVGAR